MNAPFGVYVHIPFCARRCDYCAFATWTDRHHLTADYLAACRRQVDVAAADGSLRPATSVFVGGGTPSMVPAGGLLTVLGAIPTLPGAEITVECNPDTVTPALLDAYRAGGVTRLSFGVQSMVPHVLAALGRTHDPANVVAAVATARSAGFATWSLDLIHGGAGETLADWERTLDEVLALDPPHVSAYGLTVEPGTPLADDPARHPDDDTQADAYLLATERLAAAGLASYEISNWARPGHECRHNLLYWRQGDYLGIGCAAHSHRAGRRWWNVRTPERYIAAVLAARSVVAGDEHLDPATRALEARQLALRTTDGVPADAFAPDDLAALDGLLAAAPGAAGRLVLTTRGRLLANEVAVRLRAPAG